MPLSKIAQEKGFTLIELIVVIAIIGSIAVIAVVSVVGTKAKSRDTQRVANIKQIINAMQFFYDDNNRYPNDLDGIASAGEVIGDSAGSLEAALAPYFVNNTPGEPNYTGTTGIDDFFYAYDYSNSGCQPVVSINRFETQSALDAWGGQDTSVGSDMNIETSHYNKCLK